MREGRTVAALTAAGLVVAACGGASGTGGDDGDGRAEGGDEVAIELAGSLSPEEAAEVGGSVTAFGFDLHRAVTEPGGNTVTSPLSASVLLAMVAAGAGGTNAAQFAEVLHLEAVRDPRYAALLADLAAVDDVTLSVANALWAQDGYPFEDDYLTFARDTFGATLDEVDLAAQATADDIDAWVVDRTEGLIDGIAEDLDLPSSDAVLVLVNAVYFLGTWTTTFDEAHTRDVAFHLVDGTSVEVPTMHRTDAEVATSSGDGFRMARLPYGEDERFGMEVLLPDDGVALDELLDELDAEGWRTAVDDLAPTTLDRLALPSFELEWDASLDEPLQALGLTEAFDDGDFTPMSPADPFLGTVVQKTYIRVDEEGTEAAAVTGGTMEASGPAEPSEFVVDRPFVFTVSDRESGTVLFLGTVHDPRG